MTPSDGSATVWGESGFSILEVVIALVILMTVLVSVSSLLVTSFKVGANSRYRQVATEIATSNLDYQVQVGAGTLVGEVGDTSLPSVTSAGQTYVIEMEISPYTPGNSGACANPNGGLAMLKITIWVTWANALSATHWWEAGNSASTGLLVSETTLLSLPSTAFNGNDGSILVDVSGSGGTTDGTEGVTLTATYGSTTYTAVTGSSGCALFANLTPHANWVITGTETGYIDNLNDWSTTTNSASSLSSTATVVAGTVATVNFSYEQEATVTPSYSVTLAGATPWLPTGLNGMPLTFYTSANTATPPNGYVAASPAYVYPYINSPSSLPSYHVVAGSCGAESAPDGTNDAGATIDGAAVTLTPGGQSTPVIPLTPLDIVVSHSGTAVYNANISAAVSPSDANCGTGTLAMPTLGLGTSCIPGGPVTVPPSSCASLASYRRHSKHRKSRTVNHDLLVSACTSGCPTKTTLTSNKSGTTTYGTPITFTATVTCNNGANGCAGSGNPNGGTATFKVGATTLGSASVSSSGVATFTTSSTPVPVGSPSNVTATFAAYNEWSSSTSSNKAQTVTASGTSTVLTSSPNPGTYDTATLTATVTATSPSTATPTGTINFMSGASTIAGCGAVALTSGSATCPLTGVGSGSYSLTAVYTPSTSPTNFVTSTSSTLTQVITAATTTTTLTSSSFLNASSFGASVTFTATVAPVSGAPATGTVAFKSNGTAIPTCASVTLNSSGVATCTTTALASGSDAITAVYTPSLTTQFSTSTGTLTQLVYLEGTTPSIETGLPYGSWILTVKYIVGATTYSSTYTLLINQVGIYVNGVQSTNFPIQLAV